MKRDFIITANDGTEIFFRIGNRTPRRNEYERGLKYHLYVMDKKDFIFYPTGRYYSTIKEAKEDARKNYFIWL